MENIKLICPQCKKEFTATNKQQKNCSIKCRSAKGWQEKKKKIAQQKADNSKIFKWEDYKNDIIM